MTEVQALLESAPQYVWGILAVILAGALGYFIWWKIYRSIFWRRLSALAENPRQGAGLITDQYGKQDLLRLSSLVEKAADRWPEAELVKLIGADKIWIEKLLQSPTKAWVDRVLDYMPQEGLFTVFLASLRSPRCGERFTSWLSNNPDLLALRKVALSGKGEDFDGKKAHELFSDRLDQVREMAGDPEWASRYMALKVLLHDDDGRSKRALWEAFRDPHSLVRRTVVEELHPENEEERKKLYAELLHLLFDDFVYEVRSAAKKRISDDFKDHYTLDGVSLDTVQALHVLEQLNEQSKEDQSFALEYLEGKNAELQLAAARYLNRAGVLEHLFTKVDLADRSAYERNKKLLHNAAGVNEVAFLRLLQQKRPVPLPAGSLLIASDILAEKGPTDLILPLIKQAVRFKPGNSPSDRDVYQSVFRCVCARGDDAAARYVASFIESHRYEEEYILPILQELSSAHQAIYVPTLMKLLKDSDFTLREALHDALVRFSPSFFMDSLMDIITAGREEYPHAVRISAFKVLGRLELPYCLQPILEHLPILPLEEARDFAVHLAKYEGKNFTKRVLEILEGDDGNVRAAVIAAVPATEQKDFVKPIREALSDADSAVRSAAVWALLEYGDTRSVKEVREMLRDPVEEVRRAVSRALGEYGNDTSLEHFKGICSDENEVESVKLAAIDGLRYSHLPKAVSILVSYLEAKPEETLERRIIAALAQKREKKELAELVERFKDADHDLREKIVEAFEQMGLEAEGMLVELLREDIVSLRPHITAVLEETGYIDHTIRKLSHRDPEVRKEAAELLSLIGTTAAFRGIVLAARDPDEQVRVMVTKALERLDTKEGKEILEKLQNDPERKIRKYTLWALERMRAREE